MVDDLYNQISSQYALIDNEKHQNMRYDDVCMYDTIILSIYNQQNRCDVFSNVDNIIN